MDRMNTGFLKQKGGFEADTLDTAPTIGKFVSKEQRNIENKENANAKKLEPVREERKKQDATQAGLKVVIDGAQLECNLCTNPKGIMKVNFDTPTTQEKKTATVVEKTSASLIFMGNCTKSPKSKLPCSAVMQTGEWKDVGTLKVQEQYPLLQQSTLPCLYGGADIKITDSGQINEPEEIETEGAPVPDSETEVGGVNTRFYNEAGTQIVEIPDKLQKAFNEEYGILLAYDKEKEMLYHNGDCNPAYEKVSPTAISMWKKELDPNQVSKGKFIFGYNFGYKITSNYSEWREPVPDNKDIGNTIHFGICPKFINKNSEAQHSMALMDLGDYNDELQPLGIEYKLYYEENSYKIYKMGIPKFNNRYMGLARCLEHEFLGHVILNYTDYTSLTAKDGPNELEALLGNRIRLEIGIPPRMNSSKSIENNKLTFNTYFGYYDPLDIDPDIYRWPGAPSPPSARPEIEGTAKIYHDSLVEMDKINYLITLNYKYNENIFDFT